MRDEEEEEEVVLREWESDKSFTSMEQILSGSPPKRRTSSGRVVRPSGKVVRSHDS